MYELSQRFMFEAAHTLKRSVQVESSARVHGHTYYAEVTVSGTPNAVTGMIMDLSDLRERIEVVRADLDHQMLDTVPELGAPTIENLCGYIARRLQATIPALTSVRVWREGGGDTCRFTIPVETEVPGRVCAA
jgi:6-pyruvoyltetrahydropterin/6-carboxytetrahydropterin synthase